MLNWHVVDWGNCKVSGADRGSWSSRRVFVCGVRSPWRTPVRTKSNSFASASPTQNTTIARLACVYSCESDTRASVGNSFQCRTACGMSQTSNVPALPARHNTQTWTVCERVCRHIWDIGCAGFYNTRRHGTTSSRSFCFWSSSFRICRSRLFSTTHTCACLRRANFSSLFCGFFSVSLCEIKTFVPFVVKWGSWFYTVSKLRQMANSDWMWQSAQNNTRMKTALVHSRPWCSVSNNFPASPMKRSWTCWKLLL